MNALPCPLGCSAHVTPATIEEHIFVFHQEFHVHVFDPVRICPHIEVGAFLLHGPQPTLLGGLPVSVN